MNKKGELNLVTALSIVLAINVFFFLAQISINNINPNSAPVFYNYDGSMIKSFDAGDYTLDENVQTKLPSSSNTVSVEGGNIFTDTFAAIKDWFLDVTGLGYLLNIINGVPNFLKAIGMPHEIAFALGFFWHALTLFLAVIFLKGGS